MSDTITCSNCGATVPGAAAFCTSCGHPVAGQPPAAGDPTTVDGPPMGDQTSLTPPPPPGAAPWGPPADPQPPGWHQPAAPPPAAPGPPGAWSSPSAPPPPGAAPPPPGAWGDAGGAAQISQHVPPPRAGSILGGIAGLVGGVLVLAGVFSGWVTLGDTGTVSAWSLTSGDELLKSNDPYLLAVGGVLALVLGVLLFTGLARPVVRVVAIVAGLAVVAVAALNWMSISDFVTDNFPTSFEASTAIGFYFVLAGGVLTALAGVMPAKK